MAKSRHDVCELFFFFLKKIDILRKSMLAAEKITALTDIFRVLSDATRTKILFSLSKGELCVCDIAHVLGLSISAVSHQLRLLRNLKLVKYRNEGKMAFYTLDNEHIMKLVNEGLTHIKRG